METRKILMVEDKQEISSLIERQLEDAGYSFLTVEEGRHAKEILKTKKYAPDLILVDENLPDGKGTQLCVQMRELTLKPIIFINCRREQRVIVGALESGADDYMSKPVSADVLPAKISSQLRRSIEYSEQSRAENAEKKIQFFRQFAVDQESHSVWRVDSDGRIGSRIHLSPIEYKMLVSFIEHPNELMTYERLYRYIWRVQDLGDVRTVMVHVSNLRRKIDLLNRDTIHTVRGAGYLFRDR